MSTRERILEKAGELIYHHGYLATSISDIMTAAEVGKGQLYHYFPSKKAIGLAVIDKLLNQWREELLETILAQSEADRALGDMINWFFNFHQNQDIFYGCPVGNLIVEMSTQDQDFQERLQHFMADWSQALTQVFASKYPQKSATEQEELALATISALQGAVILVKVNQDSHSLRVVKERLLNQLALDGLDHAL